MVIYGAFLIPLIAAIIFYVYFKRKVTYWEFFLPMVASLIFIVIMKFTIESIQVSTKEYWGSLVVRAEYYEDWNEYIHQTCTRTCCCDSKGQNCSTETYDCSYVQYHPPYYQVVTTSGETVDIDKNEYKRIIALFENEQFNDLGRSYYTDDGDQYYTTWDNNVATAVPVTTIHHYDNRVKAADHSIFKFREVTKKEIKQYDLKKYPKITGHYNMQAVIGDSSQDALQADKIFQYLNGYLGPKKEVRLFVLVFRDQPIEAGFYQEWLWCGANMNEFVICIGIDKSRKVKWCKPFSWTRSEILKARIKSFVQAQDTLNLRLLAGYTHEQVGKDFTRRDFKEFNYLTVEPSGWAVFITYFLTIVINIGISWWIIRNEFE